MNIVVELHLPLLVLALRQCSLVTEQALGVGLVTGLEVWLQ